VLGPLRGAYRERSAKALRAITTDLADLTKGDAEITDLEDIHTPVGAPAESRPNSVSDLAESPRPENRAVAAFMTHTPGIPAVAR